MPRLAVVLAAAMPLTLALPLTPANAAQAQATQEAAPPAQGKLVKKEVCRTMTYTGSHTRKKVCKTIEQWVSETARANGEVLGVQARGSHLEGQDASKSGPN